MAINPTELLTLDELRDRFGLGTAAMRTARRQGLKVRQVGRRRFVLGKDLLDFVERREAAS